MKILMYLIICNTMISMLCLYMRMARKKDWRVAILFLLIPGLGFLLYYVPVIAFGIHKKAGYDRDSLVSRIHVDKTVEKLDMESAFGVVPLQDVLLQGSNKEKRRLLLNQVKRGIDKSYHTIKVAGEDTDSESVHYVSAVRMELYHKYYQRMEKARKEWESGIDNQQSKEKLLDALSQFIKSDLLQTMEKTLYMKEFCELFPVEEKNQYVKSYNDFLCFCCELKRDEQIIAELSEENTPLWEYRTYKEILNYFYEKEEKEHFYWVMNQLSKSDLVLDNEGVQMIRYWQGGNENIVIN